MIALSPKEQTENLTTNFLPASFLNLGNMEKRVASKKTSDRSKKEMKISPSISPHRRNSPRLARLLAEEKRRSPSSPEEQENVIN